MKQLETYYTKNGYNHLVVWRDEDFAITKLTIPCSGAFVCYEAFRINKKQSSVIDGKIISARESTPSNEEWGTKGYSVKTLEEAHNKINQLKEKTKSWHKTHKKLS